MNKETLDKIIKLRNQLEETEKFILEAPGAFRREFGCFKISYVYADKPPIKELLVFRPVFEKMLEIYCNQLKQELKELGYEA